jgi:hypothetical protein
MSPTDVEIVRGIWRAVARREFPTELFAPDVHWHTAPDLPDHETCVGPEAVARMVVEVHERRSWDDAAAAVGLTG